MKTRQRLGRIGLGVTTVLALAATVTFVGVFAAGEKAGAYRSPFDVAFSPDGKVLAASDHTAGTVALIDPASGSVRQVACQGSPADVAWAPDGAKLYVAERGAGTAAEIDPGAGKVLRRFDVGPYPVGVAVAAKRKLLVVSNVGLNSVSVVDLGTGKEKARLGGFSHPRRIAVTPDEALAVVGNLMPFGDASEPTQSCHLTLIDLAGVKVAGEIKLPSGCVAIRGLVISPDGKWAYAVHTLGRFTLPTTQLERGWVNTNAMSMIDLAKKEVYATVLLDRLTEGAADPWGLAISADGKTLWASLAGVHQAAWIDLETLHLLTEGKLDDVQKLTPKVPEAPRHFSSIWSEIKAEPEKRKLLANDLAALYGCGLLVRRPLPCNGARGIALSPDGKQLAVAAYFSGEVLLVEANPVGRTKVTAAVSLGKSREPDDLRKGEQIFHDAHFCFQHWLSCATCHPETRADGLNWDLLNDGIGNPKNAKSLVWSDKTPPAMARGVRASMDVASLAGFKFILFLQPEEKDVECVRAYLRAIGPDRSPYLTPDGKLTEKAKKGEAIFKSEKAGCAKCHPAPLYTDKQMYDVGTRHELDRSGEFDTPTLIEMWRTAPYLHDGSAKTIEEVLKKHNPKDQHGVTSHLSKEEIEALVEYVLSL